MKWKYLLLLLILGTSAYGNPDKPGGIRGVVVDNHTETPLPGVNIFILESDIGTASDENGRFYLESLKPGSYHVRFDMIGYEPQTKLNLPVSPGRDLNINIGLVQTVLEMQNIIVTPDFFKKAKDATISDRSVDFTEIINDPGSSMDVQRMMQALPSVVSGSDQYNEIIVRGGGPGENLFVMDHIEIPNPNHFGTQGEGGGPIGMINPMFINQVDFYAGSFPARFGDKASSVMDIQLREGNRNKFESEIDMSMAGLGVLAEGPLAQGKGSYLLSYHKSYLDWIIANTGLTAIPRYYNMQGKIVYDLNDRHKLIWNGVYGSDKILLGNDDIGEDSDIDCVDVKSHEYAGGVSWKGFWSSRDYSLLTLYTVENRWWTDVLDFQDRAIYRQNDTETEWVLKGDFVHRFPNQGELTAGFSVKQLDYNFDQWAGPDTVFGYGYLLDGSDQISFLDEWPYPGAIDASVIVDTLEYNGEDRVDKGIYSAKYAAHLQYKWNPLRPLTVIAGLRYDYFAFTEFGSLSPRLGLSYSFTPVTKLNFGVGRHYQSPTNFTLASHVNNRHLRDKYTDQVVIGLEHLFARDIRATLEVYTRKYHDIPYDKGWTTPDSMDYFDGEMVNVGEGSVNGMEIFFQKKLYDRFRWILSYSHYISKLDDPRFPGRQFNSFYDYRDVLTLVFGYKDDLRDRTWYRHMKEKWWYKATGWLMPFADEVEVSLRWRYLGGKPYTPQTYDPYTQRWYISAQQEINTERVPVYHRLDLMLVRRYIFESMNLVVFLDIQNTYNRDNIWDYAYAKDGKIETVYQYKLFPVGGFVLEF